jgi:Xaa-Pro dipeptidase
MLLSAALCLTVATLVAAEPVPCIINDPVDPRVMHEEIRNKVRNIWTGETIGNGLFLKGGEESDPLYDSCYFRQDPYFIYLTGAMEGDMHFYMNLDTGYNVLFVPYRDENWMVWNGVGRTREEIRQQYGVTECQYNDDIEETLRRMNSSTIHTFPGVNFPGHEDYSHVTNVLESVLKAGRTIKTDMELQTMRMGSKLTVEAHAAYMRVIEPGWYEYQAESAFLNHGHSCGSKLQSYTPIFGSGSNGAVLHYNTNIDPLIDGDVILVDAAPEYRGYACDVTRTMPVNGIWTQKQLDIYNIVLAAQVTSIEMVRPGAVWSQISDNAKRVIVQGLLDIGLIHGGSVEQLILAGIDRLFYMHSLGHMIGLEVHDVEGYIFDAASHTISTPHNTVGGKDINIYLRHLKGITMDINVLETGMVFTIEPGIYFNPVLLDPAFDNPIQSQYLNEAAIREYYTFGGVRIEDVIEVTNNSYSIMSDWLPKDPEGVAMMMQAAVNKRK